ncbi:P-loop containing nucleoside triphosphate hydrolase [Phytophthora cactorum]|nr:P-loop containing nucleoside triphosphate hydrolase [Phytophthora cactorum]
MKTEPSAPRVLELLVPRFADLSDVPGSSPVSLDLSASMDVQLVFWEREGSPKSSMILKRRGVLHINGAYAVDPTGRNFARLRLLIEGMHEVAAASKLEEFGFVKCHLESYNNAEDNETQEEMIEAARRSKCHVIGCKLHRWHAAPRVQVTPERTPRAVPPSSNRAQSHSCSDSPSRVPVKREDQVSSPASSFSSQSPVEVSSPTPSVLEYSISLKEEQSVLYEPAPNRKLNLPDVFHSLMARIEAEPSDLWSADVGGLDLKLYEHQRRGLSWMVKREHGMLWDTLLLHPFSVPASVQLRSSSRDRSLRAEDLVSSRATLVVAPDALVEHWAEQIDMHVVHQGLKLYVDRAENFQEALPKSKELAKYDVVIVPFSRMAKEWKLHRPASAVEKQNFSRYGFEDQPDRYIDGSIRGDVSSLLSVHWLRIVVDEGHKLGGRAPTQLMQMSRLLCAERRWVMTGTPSPNTLQSADLQYIHGLLVFLRSQPYGRPDGHAWTKAIARPFQRNEIMGFYRLQHLLGRIMIRHTKESIRDFLPRPIRHTVVVDPSPDEFKLYNAIAENVRASLVITAIDVPKGSAHTLGDVHPDSLLHRKNHHGAGHVEATLLLLLWVDMRLTGL